MNNGIGNILIKFADKAARISGLKNWSHLGHKEGLLDSHLLVAPTTSAAIPLRYPQRAGGKIWYLRRAAFSY